MIMRAPVGAVEEVKDLGNGKTIENFTRMEMRYID
jgi:hypothetical protein